MKIGDCFFEELNLVGGSRCKGPRKKNSVLAIGREPAPIDIDVGVPREGPFLYVALLWLGRCPPLYPLGPIGAGAENGRHLGQRTLPSFQPGL